MYVKPEVAITVFELLMTDGVSPETCSAIKKHWNNKFYYTVASCWFFLWESTPFVWLIMNLQAHKLNAELWSGIPHFKTCNCTHNFIWVRNSLSLSTTWKRESKYEHRICSYCTWLNQWRKCFDNNLTYGGYYILLVSLILLSSLQNGPS